jgi:TATA-binding protein-associated factor
MPTPRSGRRTAPSNGTVKESTHIWEVRHAGLLGIKYEVAVRPDLVSEPIKTDEGGPVSQAALQDVVDAAILGYVFRVSVWVNDNNFDSLGDRDDDVRSVAASCLLPVAKHVVELLPDALPQVLAVLWSGLTNMKDDLSSSVGTVMDLLGTIPDLNNA